MQDFLLFFEKMFDITKNITKNGINAKNVMQRMLCKESLGCPIKKRAMGRNMPIDNYLKLQSAYWSPAVVGCRASPWRDPPVGAQHGAEALGHAATPRRGPACRCFQGTDRKEKSRLDQSRVRRDYQLMIGKNYWNNLWWLLNDYRFFSHDPMDRC